MNNKLILRKLRELNIAEVKIHFSGAGDSGERDGIEITMQNIKSDSVYDVNSEKPTVQLPSEIASAIESLEGSMNDGTGIDWWNNEGGYGDFRIDVESGIASIDITSHSSTSTFAKETFQLDNKDNEELQQAFESGIETLTGEFTGYSGEDCSEITSTPAGREFDVEIMSQIIRDRVETINFDEPPESNPSQTDYFNGDYEIKLGEFYSTLKIEANASFECDGDSGGDEVNMEEYE